VEGCFCCSSPEAVQGPGIPRHPLLWPLMEDSPQLAACDKRPKLVTLHIHLLLRRAVPLPSVWLWSSHGHSAPASPLIAFLAARVGPSVPRQDRPVREGTRVASIETGLAAAAAKLSQQVRLLKEQWLSGHESCGSPSRGLFVPVWQGLSVSGEINRRKTQQCCTICT